MATSTKKKVAARPRRLGRYSAINKAAAKEKKATKALEAAKTLDYQPISEAAFEAMYTAERVNELNEIDRHFLG